MRIDISHVCRVKRICWYFFQHWLIGMPCSRPGVSNYQLYIALNSFTGFAWPSLSTGFSAQLGATVTFSSPAAATVSTSIVMSDSGMWAGLPISFPSSAIDKHLPAPPQQISWTRARRQCTWILTRRACMHLSTNS